MVIEITDVIQTYYKVTATYVKMIFSPFLLYILEFIRHLLGER